MISLRFRAASLYLIFAIGIIRMGASIVGNCTSFYALKTKEEPINLLEGILKPILFEKFLVDILQKQPVVARRNNAEYYGPLLDVEYIDTILREGRQLHNPDKAIEYGKDWRLVKRTEKNDEYWTAVFSAPDVTLDMAQEAFNDGGFTLVINGVQNLWASVYRTALLLEGECFTHRISRCTWLGMTYWIYNFCRCTWLACQCQSLHDTPERECKTHFQMEWICACELFEVYVPCKKKDFAYLTVVHCFLFIGVRSSLRLDGRHYSATTRPQALDGVRSSFCTAPPSRPHSTTHTRFYETRRK